MSIKLISQVYEKKFDRAEQSIMICLADHAHDDGSHVYPSIARVEWKTGYSARQVRRIMKRLIVKKVLLLVRRSTPTFPNQYRIDLSPVENKPPFRPKPDDFETGELLAPEGADKMSPPDTGDPSPLTDNVTLTVNEPSNKPLGNAAIAATPDLSSVSSPRNGQHRAGVMAALGANENNGSGLTAALETLTGRRPDPRNKTTTGYIHDLKEWGATPDKCRHFAHYAQVVMNAPRPGQEIGWRGRHWKPALKEVWELWATAMQWKPDEAIPQRADSWVNDPEWVDMTGTGRR